MRYVLASWKMYPMVDEASALLDAVQAGLRQRAEAGVALPRIIVCPPSVALVPLRERADDRLVQLGAQDCHWEQAGAYTGEVSARMLQGLASYVLVGHSERRAAGDDDDRVAAKVAAAVAGGIVPVLFVGEDEPSEEGLAETERRLRHGLSRVDPARDAVLIVYEPSWAVGVQDAAPARHTSRAAARIREVMQATGAQRPVVIYGGSVNDANADELLAIEALDGVGAARASLDAERFLRIVDRVATRVS